MSKAAYMIYTRTKYCDYQFSVFPKGIDSSVNSSMQKIIIEATRSIDTLEQGMVRRVIYSAKNCVLAGMVSFLRNLADGSSDDANLFTDAKDRSIYAFVGLVFNTEQAAPKIDKDSLWKGFKKYMSPVWEQTSFAPQQIEYEGFAETSNTSKPAGEKKAGGKSFYTINGDDSEVFDYYLTQAAQGEKKVSFCSNIVDFRVIKETAFDIITTTPNLIDRAQKELSAVNQQYSKPNNKHSRQMEYVNNNWDNLVGDFNYDGEWKCNLRQQNCSELTPANNVKVFISSLVSLVHDGFPQTMGKIQVTNQETGDTLVIGLMTKDSQRYNSSKKTKYRIMIWEESDE